MLCRSGARDVHVDSEDEGDTTPVQDDDDEAAHHHGKRVHEHPHAAEPRPKRARRTRRALADYDYEDAQRPGAASDYDDVSEDRPKLEERSRGTATATATPDASDMPTPWQLSASAEHNRKKNDMDSLLVAALAAEQDDRRGPQMPSGLPLLQMPLMQMPHMSQMSMMSQHVLPPLMSLNMGMMPMQMPMQMSMPMQMQMQMPLGMGGMGGMSMPFSLRVAWCFEGIPQSPLSLSAHAVARELVGAVVARVTSELGVQASDRLTLAVVWPNGQRLHIDETATIPLTALGLNEPGVYLDVHKL